MTLAELRDIIKAIVVAVNPAGSATNFDYMEGYLSDMNKRHDRVNPLCILNIIRTVEDRVVPFADHTIRLNFLYNITQAMESETLAGSQDYFHTLFSQFDGDIDLVLAILFANDNINLKSNISRNRTPYDSTQKLWLIQVEFTIQTSWQCFHL